MKDYSGRRDFVKTSGLTAGLTILKPHLARGAQANSALSVGVIGVGNRGSYVSGIFAKNEFARIGAICDIYDDQLAAAQKIFSGARTFKNIQDLLASDVDAVYIATPIYLHPEHFELAVQARKHIFMEKAAAVDAAGCRRVIEAAKKADPTKRISVDFQQRYGREYNKAYQIVRSGQLGAIKMVRASWLSGGLPLRKGHAAGEEKVRNWLYYREHSGDIIVEQNCHNFDVVNWFMGTHPVKASGYGGRQVRTDIGNILDNLAVTFQFAGGVVLSYSATQFSTTNFQDVSETFICEKGSINTSRRGYKLYNKTQRGAPPEEVATGYDITKDAVDAFVDGARTGKLENAAFSAAESTLTAIMGREAIYSGKEMTWDQVTRM
ncbi:MAG: Gfo/Idh/MocA family oxidoreductase [Acidobacteria bacterium]|nr:Gfo/Idh/MocA family oxidoreductase [Acidobacteriota bacterium]MBI3471301.1 Gfo/Idh/MocA family oxidoreductase [Candidatus Solibacter usitatus]